MTRTAQLYQDSDGQWWYETPSGHRSRAIIKECDTCGAAFPTPRSGSRRFCSLECRRKTCRRCGKEFHTESTRAWYCSKACRMGERDCEQCGSRFVPKKNTAKRFCSTSCFYEFTVPVGSTHTQKDGYVIVKVPPGTPGTRRTANLQHWMLEHRYVMQEHLGRPLGPHEQVHHRNGVRDDNRPENLELWKKSHPEGVRQSDYHCSGCRCG